MRYDLSMPFLSGILVLELQQSLVKWNFVLRIKTIAERKIMQSAKREA